LNVVDIAIATATATAAFTVDKALHSLNPQPQNLRTPTARKFSAHIYRSHTEMQNLPSAHNLKSV